MNLEKKVFLALKDLKNKIDITQFDKRTLARKIIENKEFSKENIENLRKYITYLLNDWEHYENYYNNPDNTANEEIEVQIDKKTIKISATEYKEAIRKVKELEEEKKQLNLKSMGKVYF